MVFEILLTILLVLMNGFFVAAEFAIVKVRASQLEVKVKSGNRFAILSKHITSHLDAYLAATQLGITLASLGLGWIGEPVVSKIIVKTMHLVGVSISPELVHSIALPVAFAIITILHIVFGELAPKSLAIQRSEKITLIIAYPLQFFYVIFKPFIWVLNGFSNLILKIIGISAVHGSEVHSSSELKYLIEQGRETGAIDETEYGIIRNAFDFSEHTAKQVMVPRTKVVAIDVNGFNESVLDRIIEESYSRIPCYEGHIDKILGVVYLKDILIKLRYNSEINIREIVRPVLIIPPSKPIGQLLKDFQFEHQQIAVVADEYGGIIGIITMEDILEELVGEIQDEYDIENSVVEIVGDKLFTANASAFLDDINNMIPHPLKKDEQYETLAGYLLLKFGRIPKVGEKITVDDYEFTIIRKSKNAIIFVQIRDLIK